MKDLAAIHHEPELVDAQGRQLISRKPGHAIAAVLSSARARRAPGQHREVAIGCACGEAVALWARPERMDCWKVGTVNTCRVLGGPCWKYREVRRGSARIAVVTFEPALVWEGHFRTTNPWQADADDA